MPIRHRPNVMSALILTTLVTQVIVNFSVCVCVCGVLAYPPPLGLVARFA